MMRSVSIAYIEQLREWQPLDTKAIIFQSSRVHANVIIDRSDRNHLLGDRNRERRGNDNRMVSVEKSDDRG